MRRFLPLLLAVLPLFLAAQNPHPTAVFWKNIKDGDLQAESANRLIVPQAYRTLRLDFSQMKNLLLAAPGEADVLAGKAPLELDLPLPGGGFERFQVWQAPVMHPDLAAQYPQIRTFMGKGLDRPQILVRFDHTPAGFHAMMLGAPGGSVFIDPYARGNSADYLCYLKRDFSKKSGDTFVCGVESQRGDTSVPTANQTRAGDCGKLRKYRLALAATGEYALFHGAVPGNRVPALAAMVVSMNRVNGVFERDAAVRMVIIPNDSLVIYTNPATDPYTNDDGGLMLEENQTTCDNVIGTANYDIGHVFSTGGGGVAYLESPCDASFKAGGVTGGSNPVGDPFDIDYVAHEMGHQFGGNHTQYNDCNRNDATAVEPGSASTIMGYAGICDPDVQLHSDAYFHSTSLIEIGLFVTGAGNGCATIQTNTNTAPTLPTVSNRSIPKSTPFFLTATASDAQGDPLTFCWEQRDNTGNAAQPPVSTNTQGPMFRSYDPVGSGTRYFPKFTDVLSGFNDAWEELPSVNRNLRMRIMVRDNNTAGGCTTNQNLTVDIEHTAGPFVVTMPNTGVSITSGSTGSVTWNVASTTAAPVSCANVDILISTDGGASFSNLVSSTPNDGSQSVTYPNTISNECRIMVRSVGNVFYDVSDVNFILAAPAPVELQSFTTNLIDGAARLEWITATERNNRGFHIERSVGQALDFKTIGWVPGHGTTAERHQYQYDDRDLRSGQLHYYRLRQEDRDGRSEFSDVQSVSVDKNTGLLYTFPNPASEWLNIQLPPSLEADAVQVSLWNTEGGLLGEQTLQPGSPLHVGWLPAGVYWVQVLAEEEVWRGKLVKKL